MNIKFNVLWLENSLGIAIDQNIDQNNLNINIPLTGYYFWPRSDVWEQIRAEIDSKNWITEAEKILILNKITEILNSWQKGTKEEILNKKNIFTVIGTT